MADIRQRRPRKNFCSSGSQRKILELASDYDLSRRTEFVLEQHAERCIFFVTFLTSESPKKQEFVS